LFAIACKIVWYSGQVFALIVAVVSLLRLCKLFAHILVVEKEENEKTQTQETKDETKIKINLALWNMDGILEAFPGYTKSSSMHRLVLFTFGE
jgi:hypothetical protein